MEIKIGMAKTAKYANEYCGDTCDLAERPHGGISAIIADGQGNGLAAHHTSGLVVNRAVQLIGEGGKATFFIPSELGYGTRGQQGIEPNSTLIFDVTLDSVKRYVAPAPAE